MPNFMKSCNVYQGYNYKKDQQDTVGFITKLKIGDLDLTADQACKDPMNPTQDLNVVAVLGGGQWRTGITDPVQFMGQLSIENKQKVALLALTDLVKINVVFQFAVYEFDPLDSAQKYFQCFTSNAKDLQGLLEKAPGNGDLNLMVSDDADGEVQSPKNYSFRIGIVPQPQAQSITLATGDGKTISKAWGLKVT